jgi:hypothetical protein
MLDGVRLGGSKLLGMELEKENFNQENWPAPRNEVQLIHAETGSQLGFIEHRQNSRQPSSEFCEWT